MPAGALPGEPDPVAREALAAAERLRATGEEAEWQRLFGPGYVSEVAADRLGRVVGELARRRLEALRLYEPLPEQERFHASRSRIRLLRGSNRGGKTLPAAVEVARAVTGADPHGKYPVENGRGYCVGKNLDHVGQVMWRKLGRAGAFRILRDEDSKEWRAYRPWAEYDRAYKEKSKEAPPLIPPRLVKNIAWESKAESIPSVVTLRNGWELAFYSSEGKAPQGSDLDNVWMDEEIVDETWFPEMRARILDRNGRLEWSCTPQAGTDVLYDLHERAEQEASLPLPRVAEFVILLADNPHLGQQEKADLAADLDDEERRVRVGGEFAVTGFKVYPGFSMSLHGHDLAAEGVPDHWTRYAVVDPGHAVCAVLFAAVPPPAEGDFVLLYDELYLKECDAARFGAAMRERVGAQRFQAFVMDSHMAVHTEVGAGKNVLEQYGAALHKAGVKSEATGHSFRLASDDVQAGCDAVRTMLAVRADGAPRLRVARGRLPWFEWEIKRYHKQRVGHMVLDKPNQRKNNHLMDCARYLAMLDPKYVPVQPRRPRPQGALAAFQKLEKRAGRGQQGIRLGPGRKYAS